MDEHIEQTLLRLGVTRNYRGYRILCVAVRLVLEDEWRLQNIMEEVYRPTSEIIHCGFASVERNIRTVIHRVWHTDRQLLITMATYKLQLQPTVHEFIDIIANHVRRTYRVQAGK